MLGAAAKTNSLWRDGTFCLVLLPVSNIDSSASALAKADKIRIRPLSPVFRLEINSPLVFNDLQEF